MGETTNISWCDHTWNPWWGCQRVSPGCEHCYAEALAVKRRGLPIWGPPSTTERKRTTTTWRDPLKWDRKAADDGVRRRVFVASMADVFEDHPIVVSWRAEALTMLATLRSLDVLLLTKRPQNIVQMVPSSWLVDWPRHVWVGTTVEDQRRADERIPELLKVPAAVRFLSMEPLLVRVDLSRWFTPRSDGKILCDECCWKDRECDSDWHCYRRDCSTCRGTGAIPKLSWVIVGGESGPSARPFDLAWARSIVRQCAEASVPVFVKQVGDHPLAPPPADWHDPVQTGTARWYRVPGPGPERYRLQGLAHHGADPSEWPADLRVQQFPEVTS